MPFFVADREFVTVNGGPREQTDAERFQLHVCVEAVRKGLKGAVFEARRECPEVEVTQLFPFLVTIRTPLAPP